MPEAVVHTLYYIVSLIAVLSAVSIAPAQLAARSLLRLQATPDVARLRAPSVVIGGGLGAAAAILMAGALFGPDATLVVALMTILLLLAVIDLAWRWLPIEWCALVALLGGAGALLSGSLETAGLGALIGGGLLFALRFGFEKLRGVEALGLGDIWLATALGSVVGPDRIVWLLGLAAVLGLAVYFVSASARDRRTGVAFGAQMAAATPIILSL